MGAGGTALSGHQVDYPTERSRRHSNVDDTILKKAQSGEWTDDKRLKEFYLFYLVTIGVLSDPKSHELNKKRAKEFLESLGHDIHKAKEAVDKCDPGHKVPLLDRYFQFCKCLQRYGVPIDVAKKS